MVPLGIDVYYTFLRESGVDRAIVTTGASGSRELGNVRERVSLLPQHSFLRAVPGLTKRDNVGSLHWSLVFSTWMIFVYRQKLINKNTTYTPH
jgi:hypothetical protein